MDERCCGHPGCGALADENELCASHYVRFLVDDDRVAEAYSVAAAYGLPASSVRRAIRDRDEYAMRLAIKALNTALVAAVATASVPANDLHHVDGAVRQ